MPKLDDRLKTIARQIRSNVHADIGSDHGHLLVALLRSGRIKRGIAIENKHEPLQNSRSALAGLNAEVRLGEGLEALNSGEADSLSISGMGARSIVAILSAAPDRIPPRIVLQPNRRTELVRRWAFDNQFWLQDETVVCGHWPYSVLTLCRSDRSTDPAYEGLDHELALCFGPHQLRRRDSEFLKRLIAERDYLSRFDRLSLASQHRLRLINRAIAQEAGERSE